MAQAALQAYGRIDILVNNAGLYSALKKKNFMEIDSDEWDRVMAVNVKGLFHCVKAVYPAMKQQGKGQDHQYLIGHDAERLAIFSALRLVQGRRSSASLARWHAKSAATTSASIRSCPA